MNLPHDPFGHMKKILEQTSAAERALKQYEALDPILQLRRSMGVTAYDELFGRRSATQQAFDRSLKEAADAQRLTKQLDIYEEAERLQKQANPLRLMATEQRWMEAVRKAVAPFDPVSDLIRAAQSTSSLQKYLPFHSERSLDIMTRALAQSNVLDRASDEWSNVQRILRTIQELQEERNDWIANEGGSFELESDEVGSEIVAAAVPAEIGSSLAEIAELLNALLTEVRSNKSDSKQAGIFFTLVFPILLFLLTPVWDTYAKKKMEEFQPVPITQPAREANKAVNLQARELKLTPMLLSELRFVNCKKDLPLRATPRTNAAKLPVRIPRGQPVQVLETKKSWTKIRWTNSGQDFVIEGWVFTRYLKKFS